MAERVFVVVGILLGIASSGIAAPVEVKVKIETRLPDSVNSARLVERLNANGADDDLRFQMVEEDYDFRIAVGSQGWNGLRAADARAALLARDGQIALREADTVSTPYAKLG
jgi:hypothetical protein